MKILLKRCVALATAFARNYRQDVFFRTQTNIIAFQILFSLTIIVLMGVAFTYLYQATLTTAVSNIQTAIAAHAAAHSPEATIALDSFAFAGSRTFITIIVVSVLIATVAGYFMSRATLSPTKNALAAQKQFIGNIAHELRTPLATIKMNTEIALLDDIHTSLRKNLQSSVEELNRISDIINNLLSLNTLVRSKEITFSNTDLGEIATTVAHKLQSLAEVKGVSVTVEKQDYCIVFGNAAALEQITTNILKNAINYTPRDGSVALGIAPDYQGHTLPTVADTGIGINKKDLSRIFEPFYRGDPSRVRKTGGSGLGLAIVSELVDLHHGKISVRSAPKRGTTVIVSVPSGKNETLSSTSQDEEEEVSVDFSKNIRKNGSSSKET